MPEPSPGDDVIVMLGGTLILRRPDGSWRFDAFGSAVHVPWRQLIGWARGHDRDLRVYVPASRLAEAEATIAAVRAWWAEWGSDVRDGLFPAAEQEFHAALDGER